MFGFKVCKRATSKNLIFFKNVKFDAVVESVKNVQKNHPKR
jgi:hypothetical protein